MLDQRRSNPVTFSALDSKVYSEEQAIEVIKRAYTDLKDIEVANDKGSPITFIRSLQTKTGWKIRFNRGYGKCNQESCEREQWFHFTVDLNGKIANLGEVNIVYDSQGEVIKRTGTFPPNFFE